MNLHTRSICDACHDAPATIERNGCWLCASCDGSTISFPVTSVSCADVNAAASDPQPKSMGAAAAFPSSRKGDRQAADSTSTQAPLGVGSAADPGPCGWGLTFLESALEPAKAGADNGHWPATADPADPVAVDFEAEVAALEAGWRRDGIVMNATAFFTATLNSSADNSDSSVTVSA